MNIRIFFFIVLALLSKSFAQDTKPGFFYNLNKDSVAINIYADFWLNFTPDLNEAENKVDIIEKKLLFKSKNIGLKVSLNDMAVFKYPNIYVSIQTLPITSDNILVGYAYKVSLGLYQIVRLVSNPKIEDYSFTWIRVKVNYSNKENYWRDLLEILNNQFQEFSLEYYKDN